MENRVQIRRGIGAPGFGDLLEYELGYDKASKTLYIRNEDGIEIVNSNVIQQIIADSYEGEKNYVRAFIGDNWTINENATIEDYNTLVHRGETGVTLDDKSYLTIRFDIGDTYVLSGYVKGTPNLVIELRSLDGSEPRIWTYNVVGDNYEYITEIFEIPAPGDYQLTLGGDGTETEGLYFKKLQIERGEIPTPWRPAPEDAASMAIDALIRINTVETKTTPEAITSTVRSSPLYTGDLDKKANSDEIISIINQTAETIKIQASKIKFEGLVTANSNFKILTDGSIEANNAEISGRVTANSGAIGGWQLTSSLIQYRPDSSNNNSRFYFDSGPTGTYRIASYNSSGTRQFSVTSDGALYARNADISGKITADSGVIGGWEIQPTRLRSYVDSNNYFYIAPHGAYNYLISALSDGTTMFRVDQQGKLTARDVTVTSGTITGATVRTGSGSNRIELSSNLLRAYSSGVRRVQLDYDSLDFYTSDNRLGGEVVASVDSLSNLPMISVRSSDGIAFLESRKSSTNYAEIYASAYQGVDDDEALAGINVRRGSNEGNVEVGPGAVFINAAHGYDVTTLSVSGMGGVAVYGDFSVDGDIDKIKTGTCYLSTSWKSFSFGETLPSVPRMTLTSADGVSSISNGKVRNVTRTGFEAVLGGSGYSSSTHHYIAICGEG